MTRPAISTEQIEGVWAEILLAFGCCACACHHDLKPGPAAIDALRELFEQTVADALAELGIDDWEHRGGREYVLDRICKVARLAAALAARSNTARAISDADVRQAADSVIRHAREAIARWQARREGKDERRRSEEPAEEPVDPWAELATGDAQQPHDPDRRIVFGRYCSNYSG